MTRKRWILITIIISLIHGLLSFLLADIALDIVWSRFDGNPYQSPIDPIWVGLFLLLNLPYFLMSYLPMPVRVMPGTHYLAWVVNSLAWGLLGAWIFSKLPFMKDRELPPEDEAA